MKEITLELEARLPWQESVASQAKRFNVLTKGRRAGGTTLAEDFAIDAILDGYPVGWFGATYKIAAQAEREMVGTLGPILRHKDKSAHRYEAITNGVLEVWSLEADISCRSRKYRRVVIDESAHVPHMQDVWEQEILPSLADYQGDAWFVSSPNGMNYHKALHDRGLDPARRAWAAWQIPTRANPIIRESEIQSFRDVMEESNFRQEILAEFVVRSGAVFPMFRRERHVRPGMAYNPNLPLHVGIDFGFRTFAAVLFQVTSQGEAHFVGEFRRTETTTEAAGRALWEYIETLAGRPRRAIDLGTFGCDPAGDARNEQTGRSDVQVIRGLFPGVLVTYRRSEPEWRASRIRDLLLSASGITRLYVSDRCPLTIAAFENSVYPEHKPGKPQVLDPVKEGEFEHVRDALGYGLINTLLGEPAEYPI